MAEPPLFVPVREGARVLVLRLFRTTAGERTAVAFTSPDRVATVLGTGQQWVRLSEPALRSMLTDLAVSGIVVDPAGTVPSTMSRPAAVPPMSVPALPRTKKKAA